MKPGAFDIADVKRRMQGSLNTLKQELGGLRTGRASAHLVEPIQVEAYGSHMPLNQVASVSVPEARLISIQVWDASVVKAVEKAIRDSNLGLSPSTEGQIVRIRIRHDLCGVQRQDHLRERQHAAVPAVQGLAGGLLVGRPDRHHHLARERLGRGHSGSWCGRREHRSF